MSGASPLQVAFRITLRLGWPSIASAFFILFVAAIESFEVPAILGLPSGVHVFIASIYRAIHRYPSEIGLASAYAMLLVAVCLAGLLFQARLALRAQRFAVVTGRGMRPRLMALGRWRPGSSSSTFRWLPCCR